MNYKENCLFPVVWKAAAWILTHDHMTRLPESGVGVCNFSGLRRSGSRKVVTVWWGEKKKHQAFGSTAAVREEVMHPARRLFQSHHLSLPLYKSF